MSGFLPPARTVLAIIIAVFFFIIPVNALPAPVAGFTATPLNGPVPLTVRFTDTSTGHPTGWAWYFGDEDWSATAWTRRTAGARWPARGYFSSVAMPDGSIVLMGGANESVKFNDVWRSTDNGATWTLMTAKAGWTARYYHGSVAMPDGSIVLIGGEDSSPRTDVWRSTDYGATWTRVTADAGWTPREHLSTVLMPDGSIVVSGGTLPSGTTMFNDVWRSADSGATWTRVNASAGWYPRYGHSMAVMKDGSIILTGGVSFGPGFLNDVWRSQDGGSTWSEVNADAGWVHRFFHSTIAMPDGSLLLTGGGYNPNNNGNEMNDTWRSTDYGASWNEVSSTAGWIGREGQGSVLMRDGSIVMIGGRDISLKFINDVWRFMPAGSTAQSPSHTFTAMGNYTVTLQAYNISGSSSVQKSEYIHVTRSLYPPVANFTAGVTSGTVPFTVKFTDTTTYRPTGWAWYFGDENWSTTPWTRRTAAARWPARGFFSSVAMPDGSIVLMGGSDGHVLYNDTWRSTDNGATWTLMSAKAGWTARYYHGSVAMPDGRIVLIGGEDGTPKADVWQSPDNGKTWTLVNASTGWIPREHLSTVLMPDGSIIVSGGTLPSGKYMFNDVWRSADNGATWTQLTPDAGWYPRYGHSMAVMKDGSIILTGGVSFGPGYLNDVWRSRDGGSTWTRVNANAGWVHRFFHSTIAMPDGSLLLTGGGYHPNDNTIEMNDMWRSTDYGATWTEVSSRAGWIGREGQGSVLMRDGSIVLMGGRDISFRHMNDVWRFMPAGSSAQSPSHTYTAMGNYTVTLQAYNISGFDSTQKSGYIRVMKSVVTPVANFTASTTSGPVPLTVKFTDTSSWRPTGWAWFFGDENWSATPWTRKTAGAGWPGRALFGSAAMPDGSIVVMGGIDGTRFFNDTWRSKDNGASWTRVNASSGWSARGYFTSVVMPDGSIVLIGGLDSSGQRNDVWRSTDTGITWFLVNESTGWTPRESAASAVLPDGSIIMTGGTLPGGFTQFSDVWRSMDNGATWTRVKANAEWSPRYGHSIVVMPDGSIILTGGFTFNTGFLTDTWRSDDNGVTWTLVNADSGWSERYAHNSVVMPDGSIVLFGGAKNENGVNDTWRSADSGTTWTRINPGAGWTARFFASSVAMPDGSIVLLGGYDGKYRNDTWRFMPAGSSVQGPTHTYTGMGNYTVTLQAYNAAGTGRVQKGEYIRVKWTSPAFLSIIPSSPWYRNATINYTITGTQFKPGATSVAFRNRSGLYLNGTDAGVTLVTPTLISGSIHVPANAPAGAWNISVTTANGGTIWKDSAVTVMNRLGPTVSTFSPNTGSKNTTVTFTLTGTNFRTEPGYTNVSFVNTFSGTTLYGTVTSVTSVKITGMLTVPAEATGGSYDVVTSTVDGGSASRESAITVNYLGAPVIGSINQSSGYRNTTVAFTLSGNYFQPDGGTFVKLYSSSGDPVYASLTNVTGSKITGTFTIPSSAASGLYRLDVLTVSGGAASRQNAFTVKPQPLPQIASVTPVQSYRNRTFIVTVTGNYFQPGGGTNATLSNSDAGGGTFDLTLISVTPNRLNGTITIPADAPTSAKWKLNVSTVDGGVATRPAAISILKYPAPTFVSITPASGPRNSPVSFTVKGTNFQEEGTNVAFWNRSDNIGIVPSITSLTANQITGSVTFPADADQSWYLNISTVDGGLVSREKAFTAY